MMMTSIKPFRLAELHINYWLDYRAKNEMGLGKTKIPLNFKSDLGHYLDTVKCQRFSHLLIFEPFLIHFLSTLVLGINLSCWTTEWVRVSYNERSVSIRL